MTPAREAQLTAGQIDDLHALYGGLDGAASDRRGTGVRKKQRGRAAGPRDLRHRDRARAKDRIMVPVPVLFTAQDWDPRRQPVKE